MIREYFKSEKEYSRHLHLHPVALLVMWSMWSYCFENNLEFMVTSSVSTLAEDSNIGRVSSTHRSGRAFDLRNRSWSLWEIKKFENHFNEKFKKYGAIDSRGNRRLVVSIPHGNGPHFHVQIERKYAIDINYKNLEN